MDADLPNAWPEETIPILRVDDAAGAVAWYRRLGFEEEWTHRFSATSPAFVSLRRGSGVGVRIFLSEHKGDAKPDGLLFLRVADVHPIAAEFGVDVHDAGSRYEISLADPAGNRIRLGSLTGRPLPEGEYSLPNA
jgi:catechol 2,3-dioxygenase-like lactoylglutathione lyase family enzyme